MKKQNLKKLLLRKKVIANLGSAAQNGVMGGQKTQTDCMPHSLTCLLQCAPTGHCVDDVTNMIYLTGIDC